MTIRKQDPFLKHSPAVSHANFNMEDGPRNQSEASISPMIAGSLSTKCHHPMSPHNTSECLYASIRFHKSKESQSEDRFQDLLLYRQEHGHMLCSSLVTRPTKRFRNGSGDRETNTT
ncbi:hypothetical protein IV203_022877 [Nitzschia inconspicua]|nr:hypothetical protein IV203_022877 [Nitzschia inconspicua]